MTQIKIRAATPDDAAMVCDVHRRSVRGLCAGRYSAAQILGWSAKRIPSRYARSITRNVFRVAEVRQEVVGFGELSLDESQLRSVYVAPEHAGCGVGRALVESLLQVARERQLSSLWLNASLNAVGFYEHLGFEQGRLLVHRMRNGTELECVRMTIEL